MREPSPEVNILDPHYKLKAAKAMYKAEHDRMLGTYDFDMSVASHFAHLCVEYQSIPKAARLCGLSKESAIEMLKDSRVASLFEAEHRLVCDRLIEQARTIRDAYSQMSYKSSSDRAALSRADRMINSLIEKREQRIDDVFKELRVL